VCTRARRATLTTAAQRPWTDEQPQRAAFSAAVALRQTLMWASRRERIKKLVTKAPISRTLVHRFVAGESVHDAVDVTRTLSAQGLTVSLDHLGEDTRDAATATAAVAAYQQLVGLLHAEGLAASAEVSVKLSALGQALDQQMALENARLICVAARESATTVTIDMEDHTTTDSTLRILNELRADFPSTGAVIQASLRRSEEDCTMLAAPGSRVRLCKGAYQEPATVAWQTREEVRRAFVRCLRVLVAGRAYPMVATHDPKLISATRSMLHELAPELPHEYQMLYGIRANEQLRLVGAGERVRVYVPFGTQWYSYLVRRMAERPANLGLVLRAVVSHG
jgi:proline dehydrogenase